MTEVATPTARSGPWQVWRWFALVMPRLVGGVLLLAAVPKVMDPHGFLEVVRGYGVLPLGTSVAAMVLPWAEVGLGALLVSGAGVRKASLAAAALGVGFVLAQGWVLVRGLSVPCGCFGTEEEVGVLTLLRAAGFAAVCVLTSWLYRE